MNQLMEYAKTVSVRDSQQAEKEKRIEDEKKYEEQIILQMEIDRLKEYERLQQIEENRRLKLIEVLFYNYLGEWDNEKTKRGVEKET